MTATNPDAAAPSRLPAALRSLGYRNYRLFFFGQTASLIGTWMQTIAQSWLIYRLTGSPMLLGMMGFCSQIPVFLLAAVGGAVADRYNRHRIIVATQILSMLLAFALAALTLSGMVQEWHVFALAAMLGVVNAFDMPARQAFVPDLVGRADLINAIALNSSLFNGARIIGPAIAGVLVAAVGEGWCFFLNGISYVPVLFSLSRIRLGLVARIAPVGSALSNIREGFRYASGTLPIRDLLLLLGGVSLLSTSYNVLMPVFADRILGGGAHSLGLLMGATGIGALAGALCLANRQGVRGLGRWVAWAGVGFGISLVWFALSHWLWLSIALLVPVGFCMMVEISAANTLIQSMVPDRLRGRVMSIYSMMLLGMLPFGALLAGWLAEHLGAQVAVAFGGVAAIAGALIFNRRLPLLRADARALIQTQERERAAATETVSRL